MIINFFLVKYRYERRYTNEQVSFFTEQAIRDGFCVLKSHFSKHKIKQWYNACLPLLNMQIELEGGITSRGAQRYYVNFPFSHPFADPDFYEDPDIHAVVERLVGKDFVMGQLASDTPLRGSDYQEIHRDCPPLFPETGIETPAYQIAVNFPLVDVNSENGPLEIVRGTHMMSRDQGLKVEKQ